MAASLYLIIPPARALPETAPTLKKMLAATPVAALLVCRGETPEAEYATGVAALAKVAQAADCAVLIEGAPSLAKRLGVDGLHVTAVSAAAKAAASALKPAMIVGVGGVGSRHEAMTLGELDLDYIMFGPLSGAIDAASRELAGWWAETMEVPGVLSDPEAVTIDAAGCEFFAVGESIWSAADPVAALGAVAAALEAGR